MVHYRLEFAELVRRAVREHGPDAIAVELPDTLEPSIRRAVQRLPELSVVLYTDDLGSPVYLPIEPTDPMVEAVRSGLEAGVAVHFVDVDVDYHRVRRAEPLPDTYAVHRLGLGAYYEAYLQSGPWPKDDLDRRRERAMAYRLQRLEAQGLRILFVCGMAHGEAVKEELSRPQTTPLAAVRRDEVQVFNLHPDSAREVTSEFPFLMAMYEARRRGLPAEPRLGGATVRRVGALGVIAGGGADEKEYGAALDWAARRCHSAGPDQGETDLDLLEDPGPPVAEEDHLLPLDRIRAHWRFLQQVARLYRRSTGERLHRWQIHTLIRFSRNYALLEDALVPDFYQLVAAARSSVDDNFCYEVWSLGTFYPWQREVSDLPTLMVKGEEIWLGMRRFRIRRRQPRTKRPPLSLPFRLRKGERRPGEWLESLDGEYLCSYPPEDMVIESFGNFLKRRGIGVLSEERSRVEPFTTSLLDGIDLRETIRNWHEGRIYVRESRRVPGGVGSVIVIFDPDLAKERYSYAMTWLGEHDEESDMAFYSTAPPDHMVGPGISRCEYGGFLMTYPPRRLWDVWTDEDYRFAESRPEVLLAAGLDYSLERNVVYVAAEPPRSLFHTLAARLERKIVYIPLGQFSPTTIKRLRVFHVLSGQEKRDMAKEYIW